MNPIELMPLALSAIVFAFALTCFYQIRGLRKHYALLAAFSLLYIVAQVAWMRGCSDTAVTQAELLTWTGVESLMMCVMFLFADLPRKVGFR